jgi:hypothetical protein
VVKQLEVLGEGRKVSGDLFSSQVSSTVSSLVARVPALAHQGPKLASALQSGEAGPVIGALPARARDSAAEITRAAFTTGLNHILLVGAIIALTAGMIWMAAIRRKDFAQH